MSVGRRSISAICALLLCVLFASGCFQALNIPLSDAPKLDQDGTDGPDVGDGTNGQPDSDTTQPGDSGDHDGDASAPPPSAEGVLGQPPTSTFATIGPFEVRNDIALARLEVALSSIPLAVADGVTDPSRLVVVDEQGRWVTAQFRALSRWGTSLGEAKAGEQPIRWLQIALPVKIDPQQTRNFTLRYYQDPISAPQDPWALTLSKNGEGYVLESGLSTVAINPYNPALIESITLALSASQPKTVYQHKAGAGPSLSVGLITLDTANTYTSETQSAVIVDPSPTNLALPDFEVVEQGPVRVVMRVRGHFVSDQPAFLCQNTGLPKAPHRFGFTAVLTFQRGTPDLDLAFNLRNECSYTLDDTSDEIATVSMARWHFPLTLDLVDATASLEQRQQFALPLGTLAVTQAKGSNSGSGWQRLAQLTQRNGTDAPTVRQSLVAATRPYIALNGSQLVATIQQPWMQFREPQGLEGSASGLSVLTVASELSVGEAKAIWGRARLGFFAAASHTAASIESEMYLGQLAMTRGLLPRVPLAQFNATKVLPLLGVDSETKVTQQYRALMTSLHGKMLGPQGQIERALTFGSQLWPDTLLLSTEIGYTTPALNPGSGNDSCATCSELLEFFRSGDPKWVWDLALPQHYLLFFSAWYNSGTRTTLYNGYAPGASSVGEGQWHRNSYFEMAHSYNQGAKLAYVMRPNVLLRDRFEQAGAAFAAYYSNAGQREWWQGVAFAEPQNSNGSTGWHLFQYLEMVQNCAEFVPGTAGTSCKAALTAVLNELAQDNVVDHQACAGDEPVSTTCDLRAFRMLAVSGIDVLFRYVTAIDPTDGKDFKTLLTESAKFFIDVMIPRFEGALDVRPDGGWPGAMDGCSVTDGALSNCQLNAEGQLSIYTANRLSALAWVFVAHQLSGSLDRCALLTGALDNTDLYGALFFLSDNHSGWDKLTGTMMANTIFALGGYDACKP